MNLTTRSNEVNDNVNVRNVVSINVTIKCSFLDKSIQNEISNRVIISISVCK